MCGIGREAVGGRRDPTLHFFVFFCNSTVCIVCFCLVYTVFYLDFPLPPCYLIVRKGDSNVQVKTKLKVNQKVLQEKDKGGSNVQVKTLVQS